MISGFFLKKKETNKIISGNKIKIYKFGFFKEIYKNKYHLQSVKNILDLVLFFVFFVRDRVIKMIPTT